MVSPTIRIEAMNKSAAWFFLAAIFLSGCKNAIHRTETEIHLASYPPGTTVTHSEQVIENLSVHTPKIDSSTPRFPTNGDPAIEQGSTQNKPKQGRAIPVETETGKKGADTVVPLGDRADRAQKDAVRSAICQDAKRPVDAETRSCTAVPIKKAARTAEKKGKDEGYHVNQAGEPLFSNQALQQMLSREAWYCIASICGALFTYILSPLTLDLIRKRLGLLPPTQIEKTRAKA
jgi:hypothetical protein